MDHAVGDRRRGVGERGTVVALALAALCAFAGITHAAPDPTAIVVVLDRSSAMKGERWELAKLAVLDMVEALPATDRIAVITYAGRATTIAALGAPSRERIAKALDGMTTDGSTANLGAALDVATSMLIDPRGRHHVIVVSASADPHGLLPDTRRLRGDARASIATVAIQLDDHAELDTLATSAAYGVTDLIDLAPILDRAAHARTAHKDVALVIVLDASGSMGESKRLAWAKLATAQLLDQLTPTDMVAVVTFDSDAFVRVRPMRASNRLRIASELDRIQTGGSSDIAPALREASAILSGINAELRHVVVLSDGRLTTTDGVADVMATFRSNHVTVSAIGAPDADRDALSIIGDSAAGQLYMVEDLGGRLPKLFPR